MAKDDRVLIVGMGYVGLPLALSFVRGGLHVLGLDIDQSKVDALNTGTSYLGHIGDEDIAEAVATQRFEATTDFSRCAEVDVVIINPKLLQSMFQQMNKLQEPSSMLLLNRLE